MMFRGQLIYYKKGEIIDQQVQRFLTDVELELLVKTLDGFAEVSDLPISKAMVKVTDPYCYIHTGPDFEYPIGSIDKVPLHVPPGVTLHIDQRFDDWLSLAGRPLAWVHASKVEEAE
jgi:hypothetical protein